MARLKGKLKVFMDGGIGRAPAFEITPERFQAALKRNKAVAKRCDITLGRDFDEILPMIERVDAILGFRFPKDAIRARAVRLKLCHATGAGVEHLMPLDWLPRGAKLTNNRGIHALKTAESALMALLMLNTRMPEIAANQRARRWEQIFTPPLAGKTVLIVGVGEMGGATAKLAKKMGMKVLGVRRTGAKHPAVARMVKPDKLDKVLPEADFVFVTVPITQATRRMIGRAEIARMKPGSSLINFGRSAAVDCDALSSALEAGHLAGAFLDVFDQEPLPGNSPIWGVKNLVMTPHCTSDDLENYMPATLDLFFANLGRLLDGRVPNNLVDAAREY